MLQSGLHALCPPIIGNAVSETNHAIHDRFITYIETDQQTAVLVCPLEFEVKNTFWCDTFQIISRCDSLCFVRIFPFISGESYPMQRQRRLYTTPSWTISAVNVSPSYTSTIRTDMVPLRCSYRGASVGAHSSILWDAGFDDQQPIV